jgi:hypothetical protein
MATLRQEMAGESWMNSSTQWMAPKGRGILLPQPAYNLADAPALISPQYEAKGEPDE